MSLDSNTDIATGENLNLLTVGILNSKFFLFAFIKCTMAGGPIYWSKSESDCKSAIYRKPSSMSRLLQKKTNTLRHTDRRNQVDKIH